MTGAHRFFPMAVSFDNLRALVWCSMTRRWAERKNFRGLRDYSLSLYDTATRYFKKFPLPGRGRIFRIHLVGMSDPFYIRLGNSDAKILEEIFVVRTYQAVEKHQVIAHQVVDLGGNAGFSVRYWQHLFPTAHIVVVEPDVENCTLIARNILTTAGMSEVKTIQACVAEKPGWVYLNRQGVAAGYQMTCSGEPGGEQLPAQTMETLLKECRHEAVDLLKCDIEGAEREVFANCQTWIGRVRWIAIELHPPYPLEEFLGDLNRNGGRFSVRWSGNNAGMTMLLLEQHPRETHFPAMTAATPVG